jgi:hypothetical protein
VDSFKYRASDETTKYLTQATADYFVIGWSSLPKNDLLNPSQPSQFQMILDGLNLSLPVPTWATNEQKTHIASILNAQQGTLSVIHGAMYGVPFKWGSKPPSKAEMTAAKFGPDFTMEPLSAGVSPLDGIMTFLQAHKGSTEVDQLFGDPQADDIAQMVLALGDLLYAADDSFDERAKAQDLNLYQAEYAKSATAGYRWAFAEPSDPGKPPKSPTPAQFATLLDLNEKQARFDALDRKLGERRWDLFAEWWKYASDKTNILSTIQAKFKAKVDDLAAQITDLEQRTATLRSDLTQALNNSSFKRVLQDPFYTKKEPTICIAGVESGWPSDFLDSLPIRIDSLVPSAPDGVEKTVFNGVTSPFPPVLKSTALKLLGEAISHDPKISSKGFQPWGTENPFEPLFVEWEALYYHIDRSKWTVGVRPSPVGLPTTHLRYGIPDLLSPDEKNQHDFRYVNGRTLILPQPVFSLKAAVQAVIDSNDPGSPFQTDADKQKLLNGIDKLQFMSCPLAGLQEHLLTRVIGTHVKPTVNLPGKTNIPLIPAAYPEIGFTQDVLKLIDSRR